MVISPLAKYLIPGACTRRKLENKNEKHLVKKKKHKFAISSSSLTFIHSMNQTFTRTVKALKDVVKVISEDSQPQSLDRCH